MLGKLANPEKTILALSIASRIGTLALGKIFSMAFQRFDKSASLMDTNSAFDYLNSWDTVHFLGIAKHGYTHEHALPFFPLWPLVMKTAANLFNSSDLLTTGVLLNNLTFPISAILLYRISLLYFPKSLSLLSTIFFVLNPASIIYSSCYTEAPFTLIFLLAFYNITLGRQFRAALLFAISSLCRSNAIVFVLFLRILYMPVAILPLAFFQLYSLFLICRNNTSFKIFVPYSLIQRKYWDQGLFRFWTQNNIPNMLVGAPIILYSLAVLFKYYRARVSNAESTRVDLYEFNEEVENNANTRKLNATGGCSTGSVNKKGACKQNCTRNRWFFDLPIPRMEETSSIPNSFLSILNFVPMESDPIFKASIICLFQTLVLVFMAHWNTAARFLAYNPFLYWAAAYFTQKTPNSVWTSRICTFFAVYGILYIQMFCCFYPPA